MSAWRWRPAPPSPTERVIPASPGTTIAQEGSRMSDRKQAIADSMRNSHAATWPVLSSLTEAELRLPVFGDGEAMWSIGDLVGHLADAEPGLLGQVQRLLAGKAAVPDNFDLDRWNRSAVRRSQGRPIQELLEHIPKAHQEALTTLEATAEASLDRSGPRRP